MNTSGKTTSPSSLVRRLSPAITRGVVVGLLAFAAGCELFTFADDARRKGLMLYNQGNYTDAAGSFQNAVKQKPTDYLSHFHLGQSYEQLGQQQRAIQSFKAARDTQMETGEGIRDTAMRQKILDALAGAIAKTSDREREIEILRQRAATARNGEDLIVIARTLRAAGDPDNAIVAYQEAITKYPREQAYFKEYGFFLRSLGLTDRARTVLEAATRLRIDPEVNEALRGL